MSPEKQTEKGAGLCPKKMTIMDFSGVYDYEGTPFDCREGRLSFRQLSGTDGYCSDEACEQIRKQIENCSVSGIHFIDSGNYHYLTKFWLEKRQQSVAKRPRVAAREA